MSPTRGETVADTMTREVVTIPESSDLLELQTLMIEKKVHGVPVVDDAGRLVGVVTQTDLLAWHVEREAGGGGAGRSVAEIMSPQVYCIAADRPVVEAAALMIQRWIHRLVVVDDDLHVRGVVSAIDLLHCLPGAGEALRRLTAAPGS